MIQNKATGPHQGQPVLNAGQPLDQAAAVMILIHGRGASATDIMSLTEYLGVAGFAYFAPQAAESTWYPYSFLSPLAQNEPHLSSALETVGSVVEQVLAAGIPAEKIVLGGFSQGACLASEFVARHPRRYGGLLLFSGGLIGPPGTPRDYAGSLAGLPVFIGCSDVDFHIPEERVHETASVLEKMGASVAKKIYPNMGHTIIQDEIDQARKIVETVIVGD